jgi:hypothetical protein
MGRRRRHPNIQATGKKMMNRWVLMSYLLKREN